MFNCLILYGSQTGNVESISKFIYGEIKDSFLSCSIYSMNYFSNKLEELNNYEKIFFLCSTTGNGEMPDNASYFWKNIKNRKLSNNLLENVNYFLIAFGDTNYSMFCYAGKKLNKRLTELSANSFLPMICIDAVDDEEEQVDKILKIIKSII
jgi:sulfite reductase alpha subunit-like flavoprotein